MAIVDPNTELAERRLQEKLAGPSAPLWQGAIVFADCASLIASQACQPDAAFIGVPPVWHGSLHDPTANMEVCSLPQSANSRPSAADLGPHHQERPQGHNFD